MSEVAISAPASDWTGGRHRGKEGSSTQLIVTPFLICNAPYHSIFHITCLPKKLIKVLSAVLRAAQAQDLLVLDGEFVVVGDLLAHGDLLLRVDDDFRLAVHRYDFGVTVGLESGEWRLC